MDLEEKKLEEKNQYVLWNLTLMMTPHKSLNLQYIVLNVWLVAKSELLTCLPCIIPTTHLDATKNSNYTQDFALHNKKCDSCSLDSLHLWCLQSNV